ncbi:DUF6082 family protein [Streptomyces sp. NPDC054756]
MRETVVLTVITCISCIGSVGLTLALTSVPAVQSTAVGNAGEAYGAAAAATSIVVLVYIARTFRLQSEESRLQREILQSQTEESRLQRQTLEAQTVELSLQRENSRDQQMAAQRSAEAAVRAQHIKLLEMAIGDPLLMACWSGYGDVPDDRKKQYAYCNLIISHCYMCYELNYVNDDEVQASLRHMLGNDIVREFWVSTRPSRNQISPYGGKLRKFYDFGEIAYLCANGDGVPQ